VCVDVVELFQIATTTVFLRFSRNLVHVSYVPMCKKLWNRVLQSGGAI